MFLMSAGWNINRKRAVLFPMSAEPIIYYSIIHSFNYLTMAQIKYLVIHCTATPEGKEVTAADIRKWHLSPPPTGRGWKQVGYTDLIHLDGTVERLVGNNEDANVDSWEVTNGAEGINGVSRHIVYAGGLSKDGKTEKDTRTPAQCATMEKYVRDFHRRFPSVEIKGHNQFANKACPSFSVPAWLKTINL